VPIVDIDRFTQYAGYVLDTSEAARMITLLDRARRALDGQIMVPDELTGDDLLDYQDAVCELAHLYRESEKAGVMEILAMPLTQLSLGTLFWTKASGANSSPRAVMDQLPTLSRVTRRWGYASRQRIVLEGELGYPS
jgi:hypothetical protein